MNEKQTDRFLGIETCALQQGFYAFLHYHRYEPTPYAALEKLFQAYAVKEGDVLVDYGCGKGRVSFYAHAFYQLSAVGIEMNADFFQTARKNLAAYAKRRASALRQLRFYQGLAENYPVPKEANIFYFFHPFSVQIFMKVIERILDSAAKHPRDMDLILYYPSADYCDFLERCTGFLRVREIAASDDAGEAENEYFYIYRLSVYKEA